MILLCDINVIRDINVICDININVILLSIALDYRSISRGLCNTVSEYGSA